MLCQALEAYMWLLICSGDVVKMQKHSRCKNAKIATIAADIYCMLGL